MKVFFGESMEDMLRELRARGVSTVRIHALSETEANSVVVRVHVTTLCGDQIYESVTRTQHNLQNIDPAEEQEFVRRVREEDRGEVAEKFSAFEVRRGILQE